VPLHITTPFNCLSALHAGVLHSAATPEVGLVHSRMPNTHTNAAFQQLCHAGMPFAGKQECQSVAGKELVKQSHDSLPFLRPSFFSASLSVAPFHEKF